MPSASKWILIESVIHDLVTVCPALKFDLFRCRVTSVTTTIHYDGLSLTPPPGTRMLTQKSEAKAQKLK
jgi:hypothetical protein